MRKPEWINVKIEGSQKLREVELLIKDHNLNTVCHSANCPNRMECFERRTATFMILGQYCTRNCKYCNVLTGVGEEVDLEEPEKIKEAIEVLGIKHAVVTSVTRDDLEDQGANQFRQVIEKVKSIEEPIGPVTIEVLIPDMRANKELLDIVFDARPDVLNHNIEAVNSVFNEVRPQGNFQESLEVLKYAKEKDLVTKSGFMVGLGETKQEVLDLLDILRDYEVDMVTIGQYLQPSRDHLPVDRFVHPDEFQEYEDYANKIGFKRVASGPFVRSSYMADSL